MFTHPGGSAPTEHCRVLLVTHHYTPENGAPVRRWEALIERLTPLGFDFTVLAPPPHDATGRLEDPSPEYRPGHVTRGVYGERIIRTHYRKHSTKLMSRTADQAVAAMSSIPLGLRYLHGESARPHVVIGTVPGIPSIFAAWALARLLRATYVVEMRDAWPDLIVPSGMLGTTSRHGVRRRLRQLSTTWVHNTVSHLQSRADLVVTTTETFAAVLRERGQRQVAVVRNGTKIPDVPPVAATVPGDGAPAAGGVPHPDARPGVDRPLRALYLGTIGRAQSLDCVVRAAALVARRGYLLEVRIIGRGAHTDRVRRLARQLDAPVTVEPPIPHAEALRLYQWADTVIVALHGWGPFEWTIPSKVYEVMAHGVPVTAALAGEAADLVRAHGVGAVVAPDDPQALAGLWSSWCAAGAVPPATPDGVRWVAANATWDVLAAQYVQLLDGLRAQ